MFHSKAFFSYQRTTHDTIVQGTFDYMEAKKEDKESAGYLLLKCVLKRIVYVFLAHFLFLSFSHPGTLQETNQTMQEVISRYILI